MPSDGTEVELERQRQEGLQAALPTGLVRRRLDVARTGDFAAAGAGPARRIALAALVRTWLIDRWADATAGSSPAGVALAMVGSTARGEAGPLSDLDLVLLHDGRSPQQRLDELAERLWYPLWDAGLVVDHSVRSIAQCRDVAATDLSAAVGLLDLTCAAGDEALVGAARSAIAQDWRANARRRLPELAEAVSTRHTRMGDCAHLLEPDLKEARGGLRDMTVLRALTAAWLTDRPHGDLDVAHRRLLDVRDAIHIVTGRARARLSRDDHEAVAALLGYPDSDAMLTEVSQSARVLGYAVDETLRRALQSQRARKLRIGPRRPSLIPMGYGLFDHDGDIVLGPGVDPGNDPLLALRAGVVAAREGMPLAPATLANLATGCPALSDPWPAEALALFADLLAAGPGLVGVWEGLDLAGIVDQWIPQWSLVRSRPQRSAVHRHTVDRHSIETVVVAATLVREVHRPDLLLLAALLHDIGKGVAGGDHSATGATVAETVLHRMGMPEGDRDLVVRLVREHLTLADLATRRDHADPATVAALTAAVDGSPEVLALLWALTQADARAAGPAAWTDWRAGLIGRLAATTARQLSMDAPDSVGLGDGSADSARLADLDADLVTRVRGGRPAVRVEGSGAAYRVLVVERDRVGLFADVAGLLAADGLVVRSATLRTVDGLAVDDWQVEAPRGDAPDAAVLARGLARLAEHDPTPLAALARRDRSTRSSPRGPAPVTRALVVPGASATATVVEVRAGDRPGLLHALGRTLAAEEVSVRSAHIATHAGQAVDTFYLTGSEGRLLDPPAVDRVIAAVIDALSVETTG